MDISFDKVSHRNLFGILVPGSFFLGNLLFFLYIAGLKLADYYEKVKGSNLLLGLILFLLAYLFGMILRFFPPDIAEWISTKMYLLCSKEYRKWEYTREKFPYPKWTSCRMNDVMLVEMKDFFNKIAGTSSTESKEVKEKKYEERFDKIYFNHCKLLILQHSGVLYNEIVYLESIVYFLSGTFLSFTMGFTFILARIMLGNYNALSLSLASIYFPVMVVSLYAIKRARWKEVDSVYSAYFILKTEPIRESITCKYSNK